MDVSLKEFRLDWIDVCLHAQFSEEIDPIGSIEEAATLYLG
jgi:hypothetical protein